MNAQSAISKIERTYTAKGRVRSGLFSVEGTRLNERALRAGVLIETAVVSPHFQSRAGPREVALLTSLRDAAVPLVTVSTDEMSRLTDGRSLGGIISLVKIPPERSLNDVVNSAAPLLLTAVDIVDPGNIGAMIRTAHGLGCEAFVSVGKADPYHPKAVRTSMGSVFKLPLARYTDVELLLRDLALRNIVTVGTMVKATMTLPQLRLPPGGAVLLMGSEYVGLPPAVCERLDITVSIPMANGIDSLSVNAATAVALYALRHQRESL